MLDGRSLVIMYHNLDIYNEVCSDISMHPWWLFTKRHPSLSYMVSAILSVLMGSQPRGFQVFDNVRYVYAILLITAAILFLYVRLWKISAVKCCCKGYVPKLGTMESRRGLFRRTH